MGKFIIEKFEKLELEEIFKKDVIEALKKFEAETFKEFELNCPYQVWELKLIYGNKEEYQKSLWVPFLSTLLIFYVTIKELLENKSKIEVDIYYIEEKYPELFKKFCEKVDFDEITWIDATKYDFELLEITIIKNKNSIYFEGPIIVDEIPYEIFLEEILSKILKTSYEFIKEKKVFTNLLDDLEEIIKRLKIILKS